MLVLLDLDGTLTDPYEGITRSVSYALGILGRPALDERGLRAFIGPPLQDQFTSVGLGPQEVERAVALYRERYSEVGLYENRVYDGIVDALTQLAASAHRLAVATSKPTTFADRILVHHDLADHFEFVAGATLDGRRRHKADIIALALTTLGVDSFDAVMVGDREQDVAGARAHALRSVGVRWGYAEPCELEQAGVDVVIESPGELAGTISRLDSDRGNRPSAHDGGGGAL